MMSSNGVNRCIGGTVGQHSQTTQTSLPSTALPAVTTLGQQLTVISAAIAMTTTSTATTTTTAANNRRPVSHQRHKHPVVNRTNGSVLYEGSHIHFSPVDNKPLCSYSTKLCKQRRINGYAFCIRHILEDPSAPFRQCRHVAKYNQQKCSNAIPATEERLFCNSHMQIAGMAPKKERKDKRTNTNATQLHNKNNKCVSTGSAGSVDNGLTVNTINDKICLTSDKFTNFNAFIKPNVKLNGITSGTNNTNTVNNIKSNNNCKKSTEKSTTTALTTPVVLNETSISSHTNNFKLNNNNLSSDSVKNTTKTNNKNTNNCNKRPKRKKKDKKSIDKFVFARKSKCADNLFNYHIWSESDEDIEDNEPNNGQHLKTKTNDSEDVFPLIFGTLTTNIEDLEPNELKTELIAEKWLLQNLISVRKRDFEPQLDSTRDVLKILNTAPNKRYSYLDYKLCQSTGRSPNSIRKGICCYTSDDSQCRRPSLPFTRHCIDHILYNVDQLLFSRCTAKCAQTMTQCSHSTFDITREEPLCDYHQMVGSEVDERPNSPSTEAKNKKRRKSKPMALTRVSRRGKKRRKGPNGTDIPVIVEDSIDSRLSVGSIDDDSLHSHSDTNDITINLLAQKDHNNSTDIQHSITQSIPQTTITTSADITPNIPLMRLPPLLPSPVVTSVSPVVSIPSVVLDHSVMPPPPPLEPTEEALVASIVADLPQLTSDADFTEVLNKIPDDAFSDFLLEHQNGEIPTTEETEALEQALAMVNKDVQNLVAAAGMNGNTPSAQCLSDFNGQSDIIGFTNWLGSLTTEQRQQLNGLIDGAIASNSLSPILKNACEAYPQTLVQTSSAPPIMKSSSNTTVLNQTTNAFPIIYPINQISLAPTPQQEFVPISAPVHLLNNNLLMNGLSSHPS